MKTLGVAPAALPARCGDYRENPGSEKTPPRANDSCAQVKDMSMCALRWRTTERGRTARRLAALDAPPRQGPPGIVASDLGSTLSKRPFHRGGNTVDRFRHDADHEHHGHVSLGIESPSGRVVRPRRPRHVSGLRRWFLSVLAIAPALAAVTTRTDREPLVRC